MGIEKSMASAKYSSENMDFLREVERSLWPYEISQSSLLDSLLTILRRHVRKGDIDLSPGALQASLRTERSESPEVVPAKWSTEQAKRALGRQK